ncbi:MAG: alpha/beta hydrolase [Bacteroidetes bacterium]|nr:alpha/beta hydrolase [Bacteroidota bacterium]
MENIIRNIFPFLEKRLPGLARSIALKAFLKPPRMKILDDDKAFMNAAGERVVEIRGTKVRYYEWGNYSEYVLLVHGWGGRASQFKPMVSALLKAGFNVVAFDASGHGLSTGNESTIFHFSQAIFKCIEKHGLPKAIVGHSLGAVASLLANTNGAHCEKLILCSAPVILEEVLNEFRFKLNASTRVDEWLKYHSVSKYHMELANVEGIRIAQRCDKNQKVLIVHDRYDKAVGIENAYSLMKELPQADTLLTKELGHNGLIRNEKVIGQIIDYIKGLPIKQENKSETRNLALN